MNISEIRDKDTAALRKQEQELYDQLLKLRFQAATNQSENPGRIRAARKDLARVKTVLRARAIEASRPQAPEPAAPGGATVGRGATS